MVYNRTSESFFSNLQSDVVKMSFNEHPLLNAADTETPMKEWALNTEMSTQY